MDLPRFELTSLQLEPQRLALLASQALLPFLRRQRWFGTRTKAVSTASFDDVLPIPGAPAPLALVLATVAFDDASRQSWQLLLAAADPRTVSEDDAIAFVDLPDGTACIYDALRSPADCNQLVSSLLSCSGWTSSRGRCNVVASDLLRSLARPSVVTPLGVDQSNTSLLLGQGALMKLFRRVEPGPNPDVELADLLTSLGFAHAPRLLGHVSWIPDDGAPRTLAAFHEFVPNEGDGWNDALREVRAAFDDPSGPRIASYASRARDLGITTGRLHRALAHGTSADFAPEPVTPSDLERWHDRMIASLRRVASDLDHSTVQAVEDVFLRLPSVRSPGLKCRIHGDLHLGQVLLASGRWVVFDFEGEPLRPVAERREKHSPLRDVAGMLRSFDYAAHAALLERSAPGSRDWKRLEPSADRWASSARDAFTAGWRSAVQDAGFLPEQTSDLHFLMDVFELEKAVYELGYELAHRPDWSPIPTLGIRRIAERSTP